VRDWLGDDGRILSLQCQFRAVNNKGQTVTARGKVAAVREEADGTHVDLDVWTEDQDGSQLAPGRCSVLLNG
jgi:hypothetical protein